MKNGINRREFSQLFAMLFCYLTGVNVIAEETDNLGFRADRRRIDDRTGKFEKALAEQSDHGSLAAFNKDDDKLICRWLVFDVWPEIEPTLSNGAIRAMAKGGFVTFTRGALIQEIEENG